MHTLDDDPVFRFLSALPHADQQGRDWHNTARPSHSQHRCAVKISRSINNSSFLSLSTTKWNQRRCQTTPYDAKSNKMCIPRIEDNSYKGHSPLLANTHKQREQWEVVMPFLLVAACVLLDPPPLVGLLARGTGHTAKANDITLMLARYVEMLLIPTHHPLG